MEQPPGSLDDLQPQDLSTCRIPTVIDLTRRGEECILNSNSLEAIHVVKSPGWYPNSGNSKTGLHFTETASTDIRPQSGDPVQPDNAFSNTTVTLSYVSRSHVFSSHDPLPQHSTLYGVPSISKFSLHTSCESDKGLGEAGYALSQHFLEQVDGPLDLATQTELFQALSQAHVGGEIDGAGVCITQQGSHGFNGGLVCSEEETGHLESSHSSHTENGQCLENGRGSSGPCSGRSSPKIADVGEPQDSGGSNVLSLVSRTDESVVVRVGAVGAEPHAPGRVYISPLEDPVSPSATSAEDVEEVFLLPQASSSPSADICYPEAAGEALWDGVNAVGHIQPSSPSAKSDCKPWLDSSVEYTTPPIHRRKAVLQPLIDLTDDGDLLTDNSEITLEKTKKTKTAAISHINGNAKVLQENFKTKKLPMRSGRGLRLDAIVMDIRPRRFKVSECVRTGNKAKTSQTTAIASQTASPRKGDASILSKMNMSISGKKTKLKAARQSRAGKTNTNIGESYKEPTSYSEIDNSQISHNGTPPKTPAPQLTALKTKEKEPELVFLPDGSPGSTSRFAAQRNSKQKPLLVSRPNTSQDSSSEPAVHQNLDQEPEHIPSSDPLTGCDRARISPRRKSSKKSPPKNKSKSAGSKMSPTARTKRRRKKHAGFQLSSMFSPKEPEIKLRYLNYKEERRDLRLDAFSPYVSVESKQSSLSLCTVVNYPEEAKPQQKKNIHQQHSGGFVPSTSCFRMGRASSHSQHRRSLVCCLCGESANAMDLGDLHGPYYPEGYRPAAKTPASVPGLKIAEEEEDYSDSDFSSCSARGRGPKCSRPPVPWPHRPGSQPNQRGPSGSPAAKRARTDGGTALEEDWYSPPVVSQEPCERWLHEDCGVWSTGVFLVKGKIYGLEEAVKVAQETICSGCHHPGATLGCFFKGCPNKYHYRCALESDCVLVEENFSMKCKKHKNKTFKTPPGNRRDDR